MRIGPYRLETRLGAGGVGEVWEAWDERLERRVAIQRVRPLLPGTGADPYSRERLRGEARAAARLSHPAIVQIYDLVETEDEDWIVMERAAGSSLADLLHAGPLDLGRVLSLAREIAEGLAEAHSRGLLHRDLTTDNVVVTPAGHAKILGFGLANLSPEPADGLDLDPRSDLFSFGTLLAETVTGLSPSIPAELSGLIAQLLETDPERRPAGAAEVAARLAVLAAQDEARRSASGPSYRFESWRTETDPTDPADRATAPSPVSRSQGRRLLLAALLMLSVSGAVASFIAWRLHSREPLVVAVAEPQLGVGGERPEASLAAAGLHAALLRALVERSGVTALAPGRDEPAGPPTALLQSLAADEVLTSRLDCQRQTCKVAMSRLQGADGHFVWVDSFEVPIDDFPLLATAAEAVLRRAYPGLPLRPGTPELDVKKDDFARYLRLDRAVQENGGTRKTALEPLLAEAQAIRFSSPRFLEAYLLEASLESDRFFDSRDAASLDRAFSLLAQARRLAPGDPRPLLRLAALALSAERLTEADEAIRALDIQIPGDNRVRVDRALLLERQGRGKEALKILRTAAHRRPSALNRLDLGALEYRLGEIDAARRTLTAALESFPHDPRARSRLAQLELRSGSRKSPTKPLSSTPSSETPPPPRVNAEKALAGGYGRRWFSFLWFKPTPTAWSRCNQWYHSRTSWRYQAMTSLNLEEDIRPLSEFRADAAAMIQKIRETGGPWSSPRGDTPRPSFSPSASISNFVDELELLRDLQTAARQIEAGLGVPQDEARRQALARLSD